MTKPKHGLQDAPDGFYRDRDAVAKGAAQVNREGANKLGEPLSEEAWLAINHLSWRPAWSIRSRRGTLRLLLQWWRSRRH